MAKIKVNGVELYYELTGNGDKVIAFLNGVGMHTALWVDQVNFFNKNYKCLCHDTRGQLQSEKPDMEYSMEMHTEDFKCLLDALNIKKVHLVGTSYGSEISMIFAYTYPEMVESLTVVCGVSELDEVLYAAVDSWELAAEKCPDIFIKSLFPWSYSADFIKKNKANFQKREEELRQQLPPVFYKAFARLIRAFKKLNITGELKKIKCPSLIISAEEDIIKPPKYGKIIADNIKNSEFHIIKGAAHAVFTEKPDEVNKLLNDFLKKIG